MRSLSSLARAASGCSATGSFRPSWSCTSRHWGTPGGDIGLLLALTLLGDAVISLWLTTHADRIGRRRVLVAGAVLMLVAGLAFVATPIFVVLAVAATIGVISPSGNEVGPFLAVEQASLSQLVAPGRRTSVFARYQLVGSFATATGALTAGVVAQARDRSGRARFGCVSVWSSWAMRS